MSKIPFKDFLIKTVADDGTILKGVIHYWAKDYSVHLLEPVRATKYGAHLMYTIPSTFIVDENEESYLIVKSDGHYINIYVKCKKMLQELYEEKK